jgi:hypothetical protein
MTLMISNMVTHAVTVVVAKVTVPTSVHHPTILVAAATLARVMVGVVSVPEVRVI